MRFGSLQMYVGRYGLSLIFACDLIAYHKLFTRNQCDTRTCGRVFQQIIRIKLIGEYR